MARHVIRERLREARRAQAERPDPVQAERPDPAQLEELPEEDGGDPKALGGGSLADRDEEAFLRAMEGIRPMKRENRVGPQRSRAALPSGGADDAEATAQLADLVAGSGPFDISDTVEYVEGIAQGVDRRILRRLRRGEFALQGHLDLHGMTRTEARAAVEAFLVASRVEGKRCVLLIHGRGLSSKDKEPVLKPALVSWLSRGRLGRQVLAFATARRADGGAGAMQVLLRR